MNKIIILFLILCIFCLGCDKYDEINLKDSTMIWQGYRNSVYIIEYKNYIFAINTNGGIILLKDSNKDKE